jgi:hypothetical protein
MNWPTRPQVGHSAHGWKSGWLIIAFSLFNLAQNFLH